MYTLATVVVNVHNRPLWYIHKQGHLVDVNRSIYTQCDL